MKEYLKNQKIQERKTRKKSLINKIALLSIPVLGFTCLIEGAEIYLSQPVCEISTNLNGDERKDKIVVTRRGDRFGYVQMPNGSYKPFTQAEKEAAKREAKMQSYLENNVPFSSNDL